jgi:hypothetical protein
MVLIAEHAWERESSPENNMMPLLICHQFNIPETTIADSLDPEDSMLNAQTVMGLKNTPDCTSSALPSNDNAMSLWDADHHQSLQPSFNNSITRDFEALYDQDFWDTCWADISSNASVNQESESVSSSQGTNVFTYV